MIETMDEPRTQVLAGAAGAPWIDAATIRRLTPMPALVTALRGMFQSDGAAPKRHGHDVSPEVTLLLMPAWQPSGRIGVKVTTVHMNGAPAVKGTYLLIDRCGRVAAILDGAMLTSRRTAAASALAASFLARHDADTLLMVGTGALAPHLIEAHASVRPIRRVMIWGRDAEKAAVIAAEARATGLEAFVVSDLNAAVAVADIVSVATLSSKALVLGTTLAPGVHLDLVGAFRPEMCEADPAAFARARLFVDTREGALEEAGDLLQAIAAGAIGAEDIEADLAALCRGDHAGRGDDAAAITLFKSVGSSLEDLAGAELVVDAWQAEQALRDA
jgi:ornithine cyclodeaminase